MRDQTKKSRAGRVLRGLGMAVLALLVALGGLSVGSLRTEEPEATGKREEIVMGHAVDVTRAVYTYEEMVEDLTVLEQTYPHLLRVASAGTSLDGRQILYADLGSPDASRQILISAGIHGREYMTPLLAMKLLEYCLVNYHTEQENGETFAELLGDCSFRILPMANPDGVTISQRGLEGLRSEELRERVRAIYASDCARYASYREYDGIEDYLIHWKANAAGVDLNRNFGIEAWEKVSNEIPHPSSQKYKGREAGSEPETRALMKALESLPRVCCVVSLHSQGEILYWDCGQTGAVREQNERLRDLLYGLTGYRPVERFTQADGTFDDWCVLEKGIPSVNIETGRGSCPLPAEQFGEIWERLRLLLPTLAEFSTFY